MGWEEQSVGYTLFLHGQWRHCRRSCLHYCVMPSLPHLSLSLSFSLHRCGKAKLWLSQKVNKIPLSTRSQLYQYTNDDTCQSRYLSHSIRLVRCTGFHISIEIRFSFRPFRVWEPRNKSGKESKDKERILEKKNGETFVSIQRVEARNNAKHTQVGESTQKKTRWRKAY